MTRDRFVALAILGVLAACSDSTRTTGGGASDASQLIRDGVVVSGPLAVRYLSTAVGSPADSQLVYVSMSPGTIANGDSAFLGSSQVAGSVKRIPLFSGGFDPVALYARAGDSLDISVLSAGKIATARIGVPASRQPAVVRTTPPKGRTDVPLNQQIVVVFTQPMDAATITASSVQLVHGDAATTSTLTLQSGQEWVLHIDPVASLAANTSYEIRIATTVRDANGRSLATPVAVDFVTGNTLEGVATIAVRATTRHDGYFSSTASAVPGARTRFTAERISATGDTLAPDASALYVWSSSNTSVATVGSGGGGIDSVLAVTQGQATISACINALCGQGTIFVTLPDSGAVPTLLGDLGGGYSRVDDMAGGFVVGSSHLPPDPISGYTFNHAFIWSAERGMEDLGMLPGEQNAYVAAVNASGAVVGFAADTLYNAVSWIWTRAGGMSSLPFGRDSSLAYPFAIDSHGQVAAADSTSRLFLWTAATGVRIEILPSPAGAAGGMNDNNLLTLNTTLPASCGDPTHCGSQYGTVAYIWNATTEAVVATLTARDSVTGNPLQISAWQINNNSVVGGSVTRADAISSASDILNQRAFRWSSGRGFSFFPSVGSIGYKLNEAGDMTVYVFSYEHFGQDSIYSLRSVVWMSDGSVVPLASLGGPFTPANGINDAGLVAGHSQVGSVSGPQRAVIWDLRGASASKSRAATLRASDRTPVPSASTAALSAHTPLARRMGAYHVPQ